MTQPPQLLDTGFLVALVNAADPAHQACVEVWKHARGPFVTTEGVLTECAHLLRRAPGAFDNALKIVRGAGVVVMPFTKPRIGRALELMARYADVPMDFVDALLVELAEELETAHALTLDVRGFSAYRVNERHRFRLLPAPHAWKKGAR